MIRLLLILSTAHALLYDCLHEWTMLASFEDDMSRITYRDTVLVSYAYLGYLHEQSSVTRKITECADYNKNDVIEYSDVIRIAYVHTGYLAPHIQRQEVNLYNGVVFCGDSITEGWNFPISNFFQNRGIGGETTIDILQRFDDDVINSGSEAVVLMAGTNDLAGNDGFSSIEEIALNIQNMTQKAVHMNIKVFLCSVLPASGFAWSPDAPPPAERILRLNVLLRDIANASSAITYIDYHSFMKNTENGLKDEYTTDEVHVTPYGYKQMESIIKRHLFQ